MTLLFDVFAIPPQVDQSASSSAVTQVTLGSRGFEKPGTLALG
jgi:hypothetical protein